MPVSATPACVTVTVRVILPAVNFTVAVRETVEVLASVDMLTMLFPVPEAGLTVHHEAVDDTVQVVFELTVIDLLPPSASNERDV